MRITVIGTGYVGLVTGTCLAEVGNQVVCVDTDIDKITLLNAGGMPIFEPGLEEMVRRNRAAGRLSFMSDAETAIRHGQLLFIAVGTPPDEDGSSDLSHVLAAAASVGSLMQESKIIINKSTVPVGTADKVRAVIQGELSKRGLALSFSVVSNPEFLKEGAAIEDFMNPDRIVVGSEDAAAVATMRELYAPFQKKHERLLVMGIRSAELTKYAANAMLATRISFINELANLAEQLGADIELVRQGIGADPRIGYHFIYPGCGYGGSCLPKDVKALIATAREHGMPLKMLGAVEAINEEQKVRLPRRISQYFGNQLAGRRFALWGLAFKPNTDDMREAPSVALVNALTAAGASVCAYDPVAMAEAALAFGERQGLSYASTPLLACDGADALIIVTEWKEFRSPDFDEIRRRLASPIIFDGRNLYSPTLLAEAGFDYHCVGRPLLPAVDRAREYRQVA